ncbi:MAG: hypothetical protein AB7Q42_20820 [Acidimicrobiia bacterium]
MSYQPNTAVQPVTPAAPVAVPGKGGIWLGVLLLLAGIGGAIATFIAQQTAYDGTVENLERAVPGYRTELVFEKTGTFTIYYEYDGDFTTRLDGSDQSIDLDAPATPPEFDVRLLDQNGEEVRLRESGPDLTYDTSGFKGTAYRQVTIEDEGRYTLEIVPDADSSRFALAVGKGTVSEPSAVLPAIIGLVGLGLGLGVILISAGRRKRLLRARSASLASSMPAPPAGYPAPPTAPPGYDVPGSPVAGWSPQGGSFAPPGSPPPASVPTVSVPTVPVPTVPTVPVPTVPTVPVPVSTVAAPRPASPPPAPDTSAPDSLSSPTPQSPLPPPPPLPPEETEPTPSAPTSPWAAPTPPE